jgi:hypothetical protein
MTDLERDLAAVRSQMRGFGGRDSALDRIAARIRDTEWRPIETAPRDGTPAMLFSPEEDEGPGNVFGGLVWVSGGWGRAAINPHSWRGQTGKSEPTHWMPLPGKPPQ